MSQKDAVLAMRNAMFAVGDGMSLDAFMQGSIMAQAKVVSEAAGTPEEAIAVLAHYFNIAADAIPLYWEERSGRAALRERE
ncbi:hypothetical protein EGJ57_04720 [Brucella anthropi]|uniref:hypothetical protein n=1 Tax=Brucella anthropi TaxID=529 RepID=UPI000F66FCCD|nr:hypothetical protein [Brucella anthropi]RRY22075.1 hypothetical protein EGJ57_04720 [Brucella anthropi]